MQLNFITRLKSDFFRKSKINEYKSLLDYAVTKKYTFLTLINYYRMLNNGSLPDKFIVLRHDIDNHINVAKKMYQIEKNLNINSSYYFRIETLDAIFIQTLLDDDNEVSYHNEELADFFKSQGLNKVSELSEKLKLTLQSKFKNNVNILREKYGVEILSTASHGDFVNRLTKLNNNDYLDKIFLEQCGILIESYDSKLMEGVDAYISDSHLNELFQNNENPYDRLNNDDNLYVLIHPNSWENIFSETIQLNLIRFIEGICFKLGIKYPFRPRL